MDDRADLIDLVTPGSVVALGDGVGAPTSVHEELSRAARAAGGVTLVLGWVMTPIDQLDLTSFSRVVALMGGYSLRGPIDQGLVEYLPVRLGTTPSLLREQLRPDLLIASGSRRRGEMRFTTEISWQRGAIAAGARVAVIERPGNACADGGPALPDNSVDVGVCDALAFEQRWPGPSDVDRMIAARVASLVCKGDRLQCPPGPLGTAVLDALGVAVVLDGGILTDASADLWRRDLVIGEPVATYIIGTSDLYDWADGRDVLSGVEHTHHPGRLVTGARLVAVNTALEIDIDGQVNVERAGGSAVAGIGGQPDFAAAGAAGGVNIIAVPTSRRGRPTLVDRLEGPVTTPSHDVGIIVTERGMADLRGLDRNARRRAIETLW
ncbi:MAG: acetyl-CoA hydrolase/transferase C-terminal domain-containing protein [Ilumatobacteraceae bacterium]